MKRGVLAGLVPAPGHFTVCSMARSIIGAPSGNVLAAWPIYGYSGLEKAACSKHTITIDGKHICRNTYIFRHGHVVAGPGDNLLRNNRQALSRI